MMDPGPLGFAKRLAWYATHGVDIYQFLGLEHIDNARDLHGKPLVTSKPAPAKRGPRRPRIKRASKAAVRGGFSPL